MVRKPNEFTGKDGIYRALTRAKRVPSVVHGFPVEMGIASSDAIPVPCQADGTDNRDVLIAWLQERLTAFFVTRSKGYQAQAWDASFVLHSLHDKIYELHLQNIPQLLEQRRALRGPEAPPQPLYRVTLGLHSQGQPIVNRSNRLVTPDQAQRIADIMEEAK